MVAIVTGAEIDPRLRVHSVLVMLLVAGLAMAITLLGGVVMVGVSLGNLGWNQRQATGGHQAQGEQTVAEWGEWHGHMRRRGQRGCRR